MSHPAKLMFCAARWQPANRRSREIRPASEAILLVQDELLEGLFSGEIADVADCLDRSSA